MFDKQDVREVKRRTGASIEDCLDALQDCGGDIEKATNKILGFSQIQKPQTPEIDTASNAVSNTATNTVTATTAQNIINTGNIPLVSKPVYEPNYIGSSVKYFGMGKGITSVVFTTVAVLFAIIGYVLISSKMWVLDSLFTQLTEEVIVEIEDAAASACGVVCLASFLCVPGFILGLVSFINFFRNKRRGKKTLALLILGIVGLLFVVITLCCFVIVLVDVGRIFDYTDNWYEYYNIV